MRRMVAVTGLVVGLVSGAPRSARAGDMTAVGVTFGAPSGLGVFVDDGTALGHASGMSLRAQAGLSGGELSAGLGRAIGGFQAIGLRASVVQTWGKPIGTEPGRTLAGVSLEYGLPPSIATVRAGVLMPLDGRARAARFTWGLSLGVPLFLLSGEPLW